VAYDLAGRVALVAGATRGAGRAIACTLAAAGAYVYCTGRSTRAKPSEVGRPGTIEETAALVRQTAGDGVGLVVDHTEASEVAALVAQIRDERGRLDVLVNDMTGDGHVDGSHTFLGHPLAAGLRVLENGVHSHLITSQHAVPLLQAGGGGLVVEMTDDDELRSWNVFYDLEKHSIIRITRWLASDLRASGVAAVALTPGFMRSEAVLDHFGVTEENWHSAIEQDRWFAYSETPYYVARAVLALASDENVMRLSGMALSAGKLAREYGFTDLDGSQPLWSKYPVDRFPVT
jgi:NAD(P)-dependent dehydrogenase (short-subunit alcohol dehydrogenase family)